MIMDDTTKMTVKSIVKNGYYRKSQTLGEGGWEFLHTQCIGEWNIYVLYDGYGHEVEQITAKDDKTAIKAFSGLYHLDMLEGYEIVEKIVTFRTVDTESSHVTS